MVLEKWLSLDALDGQTIAEAGVGVAKGETLAIWVDETDGEDVLHFHSVTREPLDCEDRSLIETVYNHTISTARLRHSKRHLSIHATSARIDGEEISLEELCEKLLSVEYRDRETESDYPWW